MTVSSEQTLFNFEKVEGTSTMLLLWLATYRESPHFFLQEQIPVADRSKSRPVGVTVTKTLALKSLLFLQITYFFSYFVISAAIIQR